VVARTNTHLDTFSPPLQNSSAPERRGGKGRKGGEGGEQKSEDWEVL